MENKKLILLIDDEPDFTDTMQLLLTNSGFRTEVAYNPREGIKKASLKPDLILLDLNMPQMNGHQVCRQLKENAPTQNIPIIMLTAFNKTIDKVEALNLGVADYISKSFPFEEILARIKAVLRERAVAEDPKTLQEKNEKIIELRKIIDEKNIKILFQPIVELATKNPIGYEALTRGPKGTFLESPINLFSLAVETNMFFELDRLCRNTSAQKAKFITKNNILFLNTDPSIIDTDYFKNMEFLSGTTLLPSQICIEITERTSVKNFSELGSKLAYFKSMGIKTAIDDVGSGYSTLAAVAQLNPEFIKIDMSLIRNVDSDETKKNLVQVIITLAKKLNCQIIAEGIETENEYNTLLSLGVKYGQGYLFAKPHEY